MKILFFSPLSFIRHHSFPETSLIKSFLKNNYKVDRITCDGYFSSHCHSMENAGLSISSSQNSKNRVCQHCILYSDVIGKLPGLNTLNGSDFIDKNLINRISKFITRINLDNYNIKLEFEGINLCKESLYETILKFKLNSTSLSTNSELQYFKNQLRNSLISFFIAKKLSSLYEYDFLVMFNVQYAIMNSFNLGFKNNSSTRVFTLNGSDNNFYKTRLMRFWDWNAHKLLHPAKFYWNNFDMSKLPKESYKVVKSHVKVLENAAAPNVYSEKKSFFKFNKIIDNSKYEKTALLAMSSFDEAFAAYSIGAYPDWKVNSKIFPSQLEWLEYTIDIFRSYPNHCLIVRIHPREMMNRRVSNLSKISQLETGEKPIKSKHNSEILNYINNTELPGNIIINYPDQKISIYDLFDEIDFFISNTSTTVVEALYNNKKVIVYDNELTNYPDELVMLGKNKEDYKHNILAALKDSSRNDLKLKARNWWAYKHYVGNLMIKQSFVSSKLFRALVKICIKFNLIMLLNILSKFELSKFQLTNKSEMKLIELIKSKYTTLYDSRLISNKNILK